MDKPESAQPGVEAQPDDPVRRDREGWQAGIDAACTRLQEEIESWETEAKNDDITAQEKQFIAKRIGQIRTHIAQIRELKYGGGELPTWEELQARASLPSPVAERPKLQKYQCECGREILVEGLVIGRAHEGN